MSAESKLMAARTSLLLEQPFFGALALNLPPIPDPTCKTAKTNGVVMKYNPAFINSLSHDRIVALVAHEVEHCAMGHPWRRDGREMKTWNIACDKTINHELREAGFRLPDGAYYAEGKEVGMSAEWIYGRMAEEQANQPEPEQEQDEPQDEKSDGDGEGNGEEDSQDDDQNDEEGDQSDSDGQGDGQQEGDDDAQGQQDAQDDTPGDPLGEVEDAPTEADEDGDPPPSEQEWKERVVVAMTQAQLMGKMPAGLARQIQDALQPRVDVRSLLLRFFSERSNSDYTWMRPNPRYIAQGMYLPALEAHELGEVSILVDTSGSMSEASLQYARGVIEDVIEQCNPSAVTVYYSDADVAHVDRFEKGESLEWKPAGGGGTSFVPVLSAIEKEGTATCVVAITDLDGTFPDTPPPIPVIWLVPKGPYTRDDVMAPFGETVHFDC